MNATEQATPLGRIHLLGVDHVQGLNPPCEFQWSIGLVETRLTQMCHRCGCQ
jgi:hypothetical protein